MEINDVDREAAQKKNTSGAGDMHKSDVMRRNRCLDKIE